MNVLFAWRLRPHHPVPPTPANKGRVRAYRELSPVPLARAAQYAREAAPSSEAEYANQLREGFALKYGERV